ncbi:hypothetical protein CYMTET_50704, partial [Cymbomonas tetramitiformis]
MLKTTAAFKAAIKKIEAERGCDSPRGESRARVESRLGLSPRQNLEALRKAQAEERAKEKLERDAKRAKEIELMRASSSRSKTARGAVTPRGTQQEKLPVPTAAKRAAAPGKSPKAANNSVAGNASRLSGRSSSLSTSQSTQPASPRPVTPASPRPVTPRLSHQGNAAKLAGGKSSSSTLTSAREATAARVASIKAAAEQKRLEAEAAIQRRMEAAEKQRIEAKAAKVKQVKQHGKKFSPKPAAPEPKIAPSTAVQIVAAMHKASGIAKLNVARKETYARMLAKRNETIKDRASDILPETKKAGLSRNLAEYSAGESQMATQEQEEEPQQCVGSQRSSAARLPHHLEQYAAEELPDRPVQNELNSLESCMVDVAPSGTGQVHNTADSGMVTWYNTHYGEQPTTPADEAAGLEASLRRTTPSRSEVDDNWNLRQVSSLTAGPRCAGNTPPARVGSQPGASAKTECAVARAQGNVDVKDSNPSIALKAKVLGKFLEDTQEGLSEAVTSSIAEDTRSRQIASAKILGNLEDTQEGLSEAVTSSIAEDIRSRQIASAKILGNLEDTQEGLSEAVTSSIAEDIRSRQIASAKILGNLEDTQEGLSEAVTSSIAEDIRSRQIASAKILGNLEDTQEGLSEAVTSSIAEDIRSRQSYLARWFGASGEHTLLSAKPSSQPSSKRATLLEARAPPQSARPSSKRAPLLEARDPPQ